MRLFFGAGLMMMLRVLGACGGSTASSNDNNSKQPAAQDKQVVTPPPEDPPGMCENVSLSYGPNALPQAVVSKPYEVDLTDYADPEWEGTSYRADNLPDGFKLVPYSRILLRGTPTHVEHLDFTVYAVHTSDSHGCSTMPDPQRLTLDVVATEADLDGGVEAGKKEPH